MPVGVKDVFRGCMDYEKTRRERDEEESQEIKSLTRRVRNCKKKEAIIAQSTLRIKFGVRILRPDEIKMLQD